jgi:ketosteroid isomerase-like protein
MSPSIEDEIREMVDRETRAWDARDAAALASLFHPDMVWPWPLHARAHDPADWEMVLGRFDRARWMASWQSLFDSATLVRNERRIAKIIVSNEGDGALAVVDIDTLWAMKDGTESNWKGRVGKVYSKLARGEWKMTMHTGVLDYAGI